jgi:hypothetical protein
MFRKNSSLIKIREKTDLTLIQICKAILSVWSNKDKLVDAVKLSVWTDEEIFDFLMLKPFNFRWDSKTWIRQIGANDFSIERRLRLLQEEHSFITEGAIERLLDKVEIIREWKTLAMHM